MRILLISVKSKKSHGGIAVWTERFMEGCKTHGIDVDLVNTEVVGKRLENATGHRNFGDEFVRTRRILNDLNSFLKTNGGEYDAVHLNTSCGNFGLFRDFLLAKRIKKKKLRLITHYHCDIPFWINNSVSKLVLKKLAFLSDENIVLCENSKRYLDDNFGIASVKMPNFIEESAVLNGSKKIGEKVERAIFVGRVSTSKGAHELYELARRFDNITFELIGEVGGEIKGLQKPPNVILEGTVDHKLLAQRLDMADIFVFPSHSEGFSLALTEAMARGLVCVATDTGANADMLSDSCGYITEVGDVDAMEKALKELENADIRKEMSQKALSKVREQYVIDSVILKFKNIYCNN